MRILIDTNVWIAAIAGSASCHELIEHCRTHHTPLTSEQILNEIFTILQRKLSFLEISAQFATALIRNNTECVKESSAIPMLCRDPDDNHVLAAALGGKAHCILSGDKDLLTLKKIKKIPIVSPKDFWQFESRITLK